MFLVEADCPNRGLPGSDQDWFPCISLQLLKEKRPDTFVSLLRSHIRMPNQLYICLVLNSHNSNDFIIGDVTGKPDSFIDLCLQLFLCHIWIMPSIRGNGPFVSHCRIVDDIEDLLKVLRSTFSYHANFDLARP